jgi:hypothetical protein
MTEQRLRRRRRHHCRRHVVALSLRDSPRRTRYRGGCRARPDRIASLLLRLAAVAAYLRDRRIVHSKPWVAAEDSLQEPTCSRQKVRRASCGRLHPHPEWRMDVCKRSVEVGSGLVFIAWTKCDVSHCEHCPRHRWPAAIGVECVIIQVVSGRIWRAVGAPCLSEAG